MSHDEVIPHFCVENGKKCQGASLGLLGFTGIIYLALEALGPFIIVEFEKRPFRLEAR